MKTIKCASMDGEYVDFLSVSDPDGPELEAYASNRLLAFIGDGEVPTNGGEIIEYNVEEDKVKAHVAESVRKGRLSSVPVGSFDFVSE